MHTSERPTPPRETRAPQSLAGADIPPDALHLVRTLSRIAKRQAVRRGPNT